MIETECLWNRNISRKKPVLKHGLYLTFTKHDLITDRAVLERLSLNSTSGLVSVVLTYFAVNILRISFPMAVRYETVSSRILTKTN
jgi:hypothetical protein